MLTFDTWNPTLLAVASYESSTLKAPRPKPITEEESSVLFRTFSDASLVKKRVKNRTAAERQQARQHRFSINGHFYNYKVTRHAGHGIGQSDCGVEYR